MLTVIVREKVHGAPRMEQCSLVGFGRVQSLVKVRVSPTKAYTYDYLYA